MKKIYILQEEESGIPDTPQLFWTKRQADAAYVRIVNELHDRGFKTYNAAYKFLEKEYEGDQEYWFRIWELELPPQKSLFV